MVKEKIINYDPDLLIVFDGWNDVTGELVKNSNWKNHFAEVFDISVEDFYQKLKSYTLDINDVLPSKSLSIEDIFN